MRLMQVKWGVLPVVAATLVACGGGSSPETTTPVAETGSVTLSGSAATGLALRNATVAIKCATGSGNATTSPAGSYSVTLSNASLPCVLKVTSSDNTITYHSVAAGNGAGTAVANITPLTELVVAQATGMTPAQFFNNFSSSQSQVIAASSLRDAVTAVAEALNSAVALGDVNPLTSALSPATPGNPSDDTHDQLLDQLQAAITNAGTSLSVLATNAATGTSSAIGGLLESEVAAGMADGFFGLEQDDPESNVFTLVDVHALGRPVNGVYAVDGTGYRVSGGNWATFSRDTTNNRRILGPSGLVADGASLFAATIQQTGPSSFRYLEQGSGVNQIFNVVSTSVSSVDLADLAPGQTGSVAVPEGSKRFDFSLTVGADEYRLNGGSGFDNTSLSDFRSMYGSSGSNYLTWMGEEVLPDGLGWQFGPGTTGGTLFLYTGVQQNCQGECPAPVAAPANGSWELVTRNGVQIMVLNIPPAAGSTGLLTGQKIIYSVTQGGHVQEGKFSPAGTFAGSFSNFNRIAINAILGSLALPAAPAN